MKVELLVCDKPTKDTGRVYPKELVIKALEKFKNKAGDYTILGAISPTEINEDTYSSIGATDLTHIITDLEWKKNILYGELSIVKDSLQEELKMVEITALALRGIGDLQYLDGQDVVTELEIISFDLPDIHTLHQA